jgi:hypothetical protein
VRDEHSHLLRVLRDERERVDRAAAAREHVHRPVRDRRDEPVQVVGVLVRCRLGGAVGAAAALRAARVVGDDRPVGDVAGERANPAAPIGEPIINRTGAVAASLRRTS